MNSHLQGIGFTSQRTRDRLIAQLRKQNITNEQVLEVIGALPRHIFVDEALASRAYENISLPIGHGQTISQPYMVARMTELAIANKPRKVLEIGTGSGYQTAVLARLVPSIYSVERIKPLHEKAREKFRKLRLNNILTKHSDGSWGWKEKGPFDTIIVTAAPDELPEALFEQLSANGRLIIPLGKEGEQELLLFYKKGLKITCERIEKVSFVPLLSGLD